MRAHFLRDMGHARVRRGFLPKDVAADRGVQRDLVPLLVQPEARSSGDLRFCRTAGWRHGVGGSGRIRPAVHPGTQKVPDAEADLFRPEGKIRHLVRHERAGRALEVPGLQQEKRGGERGGLLRVS